MSAGIAALIAHATFWLLLMYGGFSGELRLRGITAFLVLWLGGFFAAPFLRYGDTMFSSYVAALDIALVFTIFKEDVRLT